MSRKVLMYDIIRIEIMTLYISKHIVELGTRIDGSKKYN